MIHRLRSDLAALVPYDLDTDLEGRIRLNANESPWAIDGVSEGTNRYPAPQPPLLRTRMAALYNVPESHLWIGRGSDEAIDLLLRAFCEARRDNILVHAPTFGMYSISARVQGAECRAVRTHASNAFALDPERLLSLVDDRTKLVIVCSPNNPTGTLHHATIAWLAERLEGRAMLVVDEAYIEFAEIASAVPLVDRHSNVAVLRTMSKAHALAGARVGALIAQGDITSFIARIATPYPLPTPSVDLALAALRPEALARTEQRIALAISERARVARALSDLPVVRELWPSSANFLLTRFTDGKRALECALAAGVVVRDVSSQLGLNDCLRITIGAPNENDALLNALGALGRPAQTSTLVEPSA